jgi:hypothetical protein
VKRLAVLIAALLAVMGISMVTTSVSQASVCQPDGAGCTAAGTYSGPDALINSDYSGFKVVWTESVVQPYSSGVPLYWTAYMTYTNVSGNTLDLVCPGAWAAAGYVVEFMSGGNGDDGSVAAGTTNCSQDPSQDVAVAPGGSFTSWATFHNVPWPGSAVAIHWGDAGASPAVYPFTSEPPNPAPSPSQSPAPRPVPSPKQVYHSVTLFGTVSCVGVHGKPPLDVDQVRIQAANGEAHDAKLHLAFTVYATTYSVKFTRVPKGGELAYVYVTCGFYNGGHLYGAKYGLKGPIHLNGFFGYQPLIIRPGK